MESSFTTAAAGPSNYGHIYFSAPLMALFYHWEIFILAAVLLTFSRGTKRPAIFWLLAFPFGFWAGNFTRIVWFEQLSSVYLVVLGLFCMRRRDICFSNGYTAWGGLLAGLSIGLEYYGHLAVPMKIASLPFHVIAALLPATLAILPASMLAHKSGKLNDLLHNKLPVFAVLSGGAELLRSFL